MQKAAESCLIWSIGESSAAQDDLDMHIKEFEQTIDHAQQQIAAYAAGIHCLKEQLEQIKNSPDHSTAQIKAKQQEITQSTQVYEQLEQLLKTLKQKLSLAREKQTSIETSALLKGQEQ
jgi:chromosome segregation ATPase